MTKLVSLCPAQQRAYEAILYGLPRGSVFELRGRSGRGKTTVLRQLHQQIGGELLTTRDFAASIQTRHPLALEDALCDLIFQSLQKHDVVMLDDLHLAMVTMHECYFNPRKGLIDVPLTFLASYVAETGKKLIVSSGGNTPEPIEERCYSFGIESFKPDDYRHLCEVFAGSDAVARLDLEKVHRFAPKLNAHQLRGVCHWLKDTDPIDTSAFIEYLRSQRLASNVELGEVAEVDLRELKGVDDVIQALEANVVLPLENDELANELGLKPKRGVLLVGPPGTGKTTVGRALAHRLKGKFFLIDGTFISGTRNFYEMVNRVFQAAKENAPAVIFVDDSDVIFESGQEHGLYRYLLTMLDGLESKSVGRVCVMMTAMDVGNLPPALVRSGRVELWLEMRPPDQIARVEIVQELANHLPAVLKTFDAAEVAAATEGFTGADLKRTIEDGKALYAFDRTKRATLKPVVEYFLAAIETVRRSKEKYAEAEVRARANRPVRPPWFDVADYSCEVDEDD